MIDNQSHPITFVWLFKANLIFLIIFLGFGWYFFSTPRPLMFSLETSRLIFYGGIGLVLGLRMSVGAVYKARYRYRIDKSGVQVTQGFFKRSSVQIPIDRITQVKIERDPLDWFFDLGNLMILYQPQSPTEAIKQKVIDTAAVVIGKGYDPVDAIGFTANRVLIPGLWLSDAKEIENLLNKVKV